VAEDGEAGGAGKCAPEGWVCLPVDQHLNFIAVGEFALKYFEDVQYGRDVWRRGARLHILDW
jgi:hypothetical protein